MPGVASYILLPEELLDLEPHRGWAALRYLTTRDHLWVECAVDEVRGCRGLPRAEVEARLRKPPGLGERPLAWRAMVRLILGLHGFRVRAAQPPPLLRQTLFGRAAALPCGTPREQIVAEAAGLLGISPEELERGLYADLPEARSLEEPGISLSVAELIERYNLVQAQSLLLRAESLRVRVAGGLRPIIRFARLQRLLCQLATDPLVERPRLSGSPRVSPSEGFHLLGDELGAAVLRLSGPLSLFHHTVKYGRAMAAWLPVLVRARRWQLEAACQLRSGRYLWRASCEDPLGTTHLPPRRFDSALEEQFFRDLRRAAPRWQVVREADAVQIGSHILCADFTLVDAERALRIPVELVGFWTPEYLQQKLAVLRRLPLERPWLVCFDESLAATEPGLFPGGPIFRFRRRIEVRSFLTFLEEHLLCLGGRGQSVTKPDTTAAGGTAINAKGA